MATRYPALAVASSAAPATGFTAVLRQDEPRGDGYYEHQVRNQSDGGIDYHFDPRCCASLEGQPLSLPEAEKALSSLVNSGHNGQLRSPTKHRKSQASPGGELDFGFGLTRMVTAKHP